MSRLDGLRTNVQGRVDRLKPKLVDLGFAAGWGILPKLPYAVTARAFQGIAALSVRRPGSFSQLRRNLRVVIGDSPSEAELDALVRRGVASYFRYWHESFRLPTMDPDDVLRRTEAPGWEENVQPPVDSGRGIVVALTHSGNWDAAAVYICKCRGVPMSTVAERLKPESLFLRFKRFRESLGMQVAALSGDPEPSTVLLKRTLQAGHMITLLGDRDLAGKGVPVTLCGRETTMPSGPALMAIQTGAALVPLGLSFTDDGWRAEWHTEIEIPAEGRLRERVTIATQALADRYTEHFRAHPEDWHMLQPIWPGV